jgi:tripartite-type tricarboxylate transporter receptor subunit TctC
MIHRRTVLAAAGLLATPALAQPAWPGRGPIRLVPTAPPGGLADTVARLIAPPLAAALGQNIIVENKPGAGGVIGTDSVAKSPPDGYTFLMTHAGVMVYSAATLPSLPFDPIGDFKHLGMLVEAPSVLLVRGDSPFRTLADYIAAARTRPVRYGSSGAGSALHILGAMLTGAADLRELDHTPYQGSGPAIRDLLGGHIESVIDPITTNVEALRSRQLRALAVSTRERLAAFPDVPTFAEQGYPTIVQTVWLGLSGPRGLPAPIADRMRAAIPVVLREPSIQQRAAQLVTLSRDPPPLGADFVEIIRADMRTAREVARRYNITAAS